MAHSKTEIFNLALGALLLNRRLEDSETDRSNEAKALRTHWDTALYTALAEMDLDGTMTTAKLERVAGTVPSSLFWQSAYKYPTNCARFRRLRSNVRRDNRYSKIPSATGILNNIKVIFTNEQYAVAEYIPTDFPLSALSPHAGLAVAYKLAMMCAPLIVGKGASKRVEDLMKHFTLAKAEAQAQDHYENIQFEVPEEESEFVAERLS